MNSNPELDRSRHPVSGLAAAALCACLLGCRAVEPSIEQDQGEPAPEPVWTSLAEEFPELFPLSEPAPEAPRHRDQIEVAPEPPRIGDDQRLAVEFRNAPLAQVVHFLADQGGLNVHLDPTLDWPVDVSFPDVTLDQAFRSLLERNGLGLVEEPEGIYWISVDDGSQPAAASFTVQSIDPLEVEPNLRALIGASTRLVVDASQNLIVVRGPQADVELVADYLDSADRLKRQVLIEVRILEVSLGENFDLGIAATLSDATIDGHLLSSMLDLSSSEDAFSMTFTERGGDFDATLQALQRFAGIHLVSSPRVLALTGTEASINVVQEVPYVDVTATTSGTTGGVGSTVVEEVRFKEAGIQLLVTPTIQEGGMVLVRVEQTFSEVVDRFLDIPVIDSRMLKAEFLVRNDQTAVMGGLMQDKRTETDRGVPGLMRLPILGRLFRSDSDEIVKRELLVFFTPHIVEPADVPRLTEVFKASYREQVRTTGVRGRSGGPR